MTTADLLCAARAVKPAAAALSTAEKNRLLEAMAQALLDHADNILAANAADVEAARGVIAPVMIDRLSLSPARVESMAEGMRAVAALPDPVGELLSETARSNGLVIRKVRVPMGVIAIIYESRPNVTADAFGLCFKTGNVVVLKGGSDAMHSNIAIVKVIREALRACKVDEDAIQLIEDTDRAVTTALMKRKDFLDVLIPRGGAGLIRAVVENSTVPVIETGTGNCHIYVDESADLDMAVNIIFNAKTQRIGVCNACESLVVHEKVEKALMPLLKAKLDEKSVEIRGDEQVQESVSGIVPAVESDWGKEYLDYILSVKTVSSIDEAIAHINRYNTGHSEAIITNNYSNAEKFLNEIDA
ncbi:MAG: glutamate-5-semialdehyde dehydrogenase, partial [Ruthenibacterium lactatiformans]|nr:glutamate-5-semialdehyde dehydrogenase [Ruthenibacterium lactatiformans]